jgi:hypothetical protein
MNEPAEKSFFFIVCRLFRRGREAAHVITFDRGALRTQRAACRSRGSGNKDSNRGELKENTPVTLHHEVNRLEVLKRRLFDNTFGVAKHETEVTLV